MASSRKSSRSAPPFHPPLKKGGDTAGGGSPLTKGGRKAGGLAARVAAKLKDIVKPSDRLLVGLSGGVDSVALLDCLLRVSRLLQFRLSALHINHQLSPNAGRWSAFCKTLCTGRGIPFQSVKVKVRRGDSLEAAARAERYAVFATRDCDYVVLAHHRDDQVETLLLQLLRGAGVKGLAAMPTLRKGKGKREKGSPSAVSRQSSPDILRPLLDTTRAEILEYAKKRKLKWIEDESNADTHFQRNFLRREVLPIIERRFPSYRNTLARSAHHLAEAARLLDEVAAADAAGYLEQETLAVEALRRLPAQRARNLLRYFLSSHGLSMPGTERLEEALRQALKAKQDARVVIELDGAMLRRHAGKLHVVRPGRPLPRDYARRWRGEHALALPELGGVLVMASAKGDGISRARLGTGSVTIRVRRGGERLRPDRRRPRRSLKNLLQEARVPPWRRERLPLIFCDGELVWVAGIGVDCAFRPARDEAALRPEWKPVA